MDNVTGRTARLTRVLALAAVVALLLAPLPGRWSRGWRGKALDLGHVPLFAGLALVLTRPGRSPVPPAVFAAGLAGAAELAQAFVGRNADWGDFARGALGAAAAAAGVHAWRARRTPGRAAGFAVLAIGFLAWPAADIGPRLIDAAEGYDAFPVLADFRTPRESTRWECRQAELTRVPDPDRPGEWVGRLDLRPGPDPYPTGILEPIVGDFRGHRWLGCAFDVEGGPVEVVLSVRTGAGRENATTHYQTGRAFAPGPHTARLNLSDAAPKGEEGPLDLSDVRSVQLFTTRLSEPRTLVIRRVWLEP